MADQRKRTGLTSEYEEWLRQQLARLSAESNDGSLSSPPLTKYADIEDPRAGRTGLGKPIGSFLDALVRPGRVAQMDADQRALQDRRMQYAEQRPMIQAQTSALMTDNQLEKLKLLALDSSDPKVQAEAQDLLGKYTQLLSPRAGGGGLDYGMITGAMGQGPGGMKLVRKPGAGGTTGGSAPVENPYMNMTRDEAIKAFDNTSKELDSYIARYESIAAGGGRARRGRWENLKGIFSDQDSVETTPNEVQDAVDRVEAGKKSKRKLEKQIKEAHNWSPTNAGGPPLTSPSSAAERIIR